MRVVDVLNMAVVASLALAASFVAYQLWAIRRLMESTKIADDFPTWPLRPVAGGGGPPPPYGDVEGVTEIMGNSGSHHHFTAAQPETHRGAVAGNSGSHHHFSASRPTEGPGVPASALADLGFCVWSYRAGEWEVLLRNTREGIDPGPPPDMPGEYEGQCVRTLCAAELV